MTTEKKLALIEALLTADYPYEFRACATLPVQVGLLSEELQAQLPALQRLIKTIDARLVATHKLYPEEDYLGYHVFSIEYHNDDNDDTPPEAVPVGPVQWNDFNVN